MAKILDLVGLFMAGADPLATKDWYARVLCPMVNDYRRFAWLTDPDGCKLEL